MFTRGKNHQKLAEELGATWTGTALDTPHKKMDSAIIFAPSGELVPIAMKNLDQGGTLALGGIHMSQIPAMNYTNHLYHERIIRSVTANTRADGHELLQVAAEIPIKTKTELFPLSEANRALQLLKEGSINGAGVLSIV